MSKYVKGVPENCKKNVTKCNFVCKRSLEKPWLVVGGVPREGIEGEPGVVGELLKENVDCGRHLQSVPGIPVTTLVGG